MVKKAVLSASIMVAALAAQPARAIDIMPGDYTVLPSGSTTFMLYGQYAHAGKFSVDGAAPRTVPGSDLGVAVGLARSVHYFDIDGVPMAVQAFLPFGGFTSARVGGADLRRNDGIGDLTAGLTVWPVHSAEPTGTTIGLTAYVTAPTGAFDNHANTVNLGSGAWTFTPQLGIIQGLGSGFFVDLAADVAVRDDHTVLGANIRRDPSVQAQAFLRYQFTPTTNVSVGYSGTFGGKDYVDGVYARTRTREDQLRVAASTFLTKTIQIQAMVGTDLATEAGFKQDVVGTLRLLTIF